MLKITLILFFVFSLSISVKQYKESCSYTSECKGSLECITKKGQSSYKCLCKYGYGFNTSDCQSFNTFKCINDDQCQDEDPHRVCGTTGKCQCNMGYNQGTNYVCVKPPADHLGQCDNNNDCKGSLDCIKSKCLCKQGYFWSKTDGDCKSISSYECGQDSDCQDVDKNRICSTKTDKCECKDGYHAYYSSDLCSRIGSLHNSTCNNDTDCSSGLKCTKVNDAKRCLCSPGKLWNKDSATCHSMDTAACQEDSDCQDQDSKYICNSNHRCQCKLDYRQNYKYLCELKSAYHEACTPPKFLSENTCQSNLTCSNNTCLCTQGYVWSEADHKCKPFQDGKCTTDKICQDHDKQRICDSASKKCVCKQGMFEDKMKLCAIQSYLGQKCNETTECSAANSFCHRATCKDQIGFCVCKPTHRRSNNTCLLITCSSNSECLSNIIEEDANFVCDGNGHCNCQIGYKLNLLEGRCVYDGSSGNQTRPNFVNSLKYNYFLITISLIAIVKLI